MIYKKLKFWSVHKNYFNFYKLHFAEKLIIARWLLPGLQFDRAKATILSLLLSGEAYTFWKGGKLEQF